MQEKGVFLNGTPSQRNDIKTYDLKNKKRDRSVALKSGLLDKSHREALDSRLALHNKQKASKALSRNINHDSFEDHIAPNMKDYSTVVESSLKKLKDKNYESWSMLVKLCFDSPLRKVYKEDKVSTTKTDVNPVELMRFHPFFNQLNFQTLKYFLTVTNLCKLAPNTLLYARSHPSKSVFIILFGTIIIHHDELGALGVLTMENTVGEES